jgi:hypothetical protein
MAAGGNRIDDLPPDTSGAPGDARSVPGRRAHLCRRCRPGREPHAASDKGKGVVPRLETRPSTLGCSRPGRRQLVSSALQLAGALLPSAGHVPNSAGPTKIEHRTAGSEGVALPGG